MFEILLILKSNFTTKIRHKWGCATKIVNGTSECNSRHINEDVLEATYLAALNELIENAAEVVDAVKEGAGMTLEPENKAALEQVDEDIIKVQEAVLALHKAKQRMEIGAQDYAAKVKEYSEQMKALGLFCLLITKTVLSLLRRDGFLIRGKISNPRHAERAG